MAQYSKIRKEEIREKEKSVFKNLGYCVGFEFDVECFSKHFGFCARIIK